MLLAIILVLLVLTVAIAVGTHFRNARASRPAVDGGNRKDFFGDRLLLPQDQMNH
jgi:hypothetical protein